MMRKALGKIIMLLAVVMLSMNVGYAQNTDCDVLLPPFVETFNSNSATEDCWTIVNANNDNLTWNLDYNSTYFSYEGDQCASINKNWNSTSNDDYLISPTIELNGNQRLIFYYRSVSATLPLDLEVLVSTNGTDISEFTNVIMETETITNTAYVEKIINLDQFSGNVNIAFRTPPTETTSWTLFLDYVTVEDLAACTEPANLIAENLTDTTADLSWDAGFNETQYEIVVQPIAATAPTGPGELINGNSYQATGLEAATFYEYYVRSYCDEENQSEWVGPFNFTTTACNPDDACNYTVTVEATSNSGNFSVLTVTQNGVVNGTLNMNGEVVTGSFPMCPDVDFEMNWSTSYWHVYTSSIIVTDAFDEIVYTWNNGDDPMTPFLQGTATCSQVACPLPTDITLVDQTQNSITVDWLPQGSTDLWEVYYVLAGTAVPSDDVAVQGDVTSTHPYEITGLQSGQVYDVYIRSVCGEEDGNSSWTQIEQFGTLIENDDCEGAITLEVSDSPFCENSYPATINMATASNTGDVCGDASFANDDVWFEFTATATSHVVYIKNILEDGDVETQNTSHNLNKVIYEGDCNNLQQIMCVEDDNSDEFSYFGGFYTAPTVNYDDILLENLTVGNTYKIRVYSNYEEQKNYTFDICIITPENAISIDQDTYDPQGLVSSILMQDDCISIDNFSAITGATYGAAHSGIAYFDAQDTQFPFANGILLTTGDASVASGAKLTMQSESYYSPTGTSLWPGDADLQEYLAAAYEGEVAVNLFDATVLEFDFIAYGDYMSFNFLFASEDYGVYQCDYGDGFAFLLTDDQGVTTNLAVVPNTTDPISVRTIRDAAYNAMCDSANADYFGNVFDGMTGESRYASSNNFYGATVPMTASANLEFGHQYHLKLVIADETDGNWDSGVFIEGGSFNMTNNLNIGEDVLLGSDEAVCEGQPFVIDLGVMAEGTQFTWFIDGEVIEGENESILTATTTGNYSVEIVFPNTDCVNSDARRIEFYPQPEASFPESEIYICANEGTTLEVSVANENQFTTDLVYTWYNNENQIVQTSTSATYVIAPNSGEFGHFTVVVSEAGANNCEASAEVDVLYSDNPNCIVPQGLSPGVSEGQNDCLDLDFFSFQGRTVNLQVFNRYGKEVFAMNNYVDQWCGTNEDGEVLPVGTYFYVISFTDGSDPLTGYIYINY